jgi:hypothetical protein
MTTQLLISSTPEFLFAEMVSKIEMMPSASVISDDPLDIEYLQDEISNYFPSQSFTTAHYSDFPAMIAQSQHSKSSIVIARIVMDGFFDFLKQADREGVTVIALVDGTQEEIQAARFIGVEYVSKSDFFLNSAVRHLFRNENAIV